MRVVCSWSGGIDSTGVVASLLKQGHTVRAVTFDIYGGAFWDREEAARRQLFTRLRELGDVEWRQRDAKWIWAFSPDGVEIPRRNKHILDRLATVEAPEFDTKTVGMGEYIGADTWLVRDHVSAHDADARALAAYLYYEHGLDYRLITLADFGESRYKVDRLRICRDAIGDAISLTSVCLRDFPVHCGECYKCVERAVAFDLLEERDRTEYQRDPRAAVDYATYRMQMCGMNPTRSMDAFPHDQMPVKAGERGS